MRFLCQSTGYRKSCFAAETGKCRHFSLDAGTVFIDGSLIIFAIAYLTIRWLGAKGTGQLLGVGLLWVVLTVGFEIGLGRWVLGLSWERIGSDYDVAQGGLMGFGLLFLAAAPWLAARARRLV